jgi:hypothetical protein
VKASSRISTELNHLHDRVLRERSVPNLDESVIEADLTERTDEILGLGRMRVAHSPASLSEWDPEDHGYNGLAA